MKTVKILTGLGLCALLLSFTLGGDRYVIKLDTKEVADQFVTRNASLPTVALPARDRTKTLSVYYSECGRVGTDRSLTLKNSDQQVLKVWRFGDDALETMEISTGELVAAMRSQSNYLYYNSREHRGGQKLISITRAASTAK